MDAFTQLQRGDRSHPPRPVYNEWLVASNLRRRYGGQRVLPRCVPLDRRVRAVAMGTAGFAATTATTPDGVTHATVASDGKISF